MSVSEKLNEKFDLPPGAIVVAPPQELLPVDALPEDAETTRLTIHELIQKGKSAVDGALAVALQSDAPRAYEAVALLLKTVADMSKDLLDAKKKARDLDAPSEKGVKGTPTNQTNIFVGSTAELLKAMRSASSTLAEATAHVETVEAEVIQEET